MENTESKTEQAPITPTEYFNQVKDRKKSITDNELVKVYDNALTLIEKYRITGQISGMKRLMFQLETVTKERQIVKMGINTFVYRSDVEEYIENISDKCVKIIDLAYYQREIPDEIINIIEKTRGIFDNYYVVFTDYTGEAEKEIAQERRDKDPILFGVFKDPDKRKVFVDRFYYLGDWEDEYCDLTLDKMISEMESCDKRIVRTIKTPSDLEELKQQIAQLEEKESRNGSFKAMPDPPVKKNVFKKITTFFGRRKNG